MDVPILGGVIEESKSHPYTMLALVALLVAVPYISKTTASAADLQAVQQQLQQLSANVTRSSLEQRLQSVESELFNLKQKIADKERAHAVVDPLNYERVNHLEIEKGQLERQLASMR